MNNFTILYEDHDLIIINKLACDPVQNDKTHDFALITQVNQNLQEKAANDKKIKLGLPHRIDRPTSGIVIFTKTKRALQVMNQLFQEKKIRKTYWAVTDAKPPAEHGELVHYLTFDKNNNKTFAHDTEVKRSKKAVLEYRLAGQTDHYYLIEAKIITGRQHQIRAQFARIGLHIKGDCKYGFKRANPNRMIHLHARAVEFNHPLTGLPFKIDAPPPEDPLWQIFINLEK